MLLIGGGFYLRSPNANSKTLTYTQFREALGKGLIMKEKLAIVSEPGSATDMIRGYYQTSKDAKPEPFRTQVNPNYNKYIEDELAAHGIVPDMESGSNNLFVSAMLNFLPIRYFVTTSHTFY